EGLYTQGLISYPRTETDQFDAQFDFMTLINMQTQDPQWGEYAQLIRDGEFQRPRNGKNNDKAHPPIHPTGYDQRLSGDAKRLYEFIVRRFLASCWKNAIGHETTVEVKMDTEYFDTKGLVILERNYLEVYPYDKWSGNEIPEFQEGHEFVPDTLEMMSGQTSPPRLLTETDLISMMEKNEIGTDATIAEHIQKILDREYVYKENQYFKPLTLGIALIKGYDQIGFESSLSKPFLRRQMEADLKSICQGTIQPNEVLRRSVYRYKEMFMQLQMDFTRIRSSMDAHYREVEDRLHRSHRTGGSGPFNTPQNTTSNRGRGGSGRARGSGTRGRGTRGRGGRKNASNGFPAQPPRDQAPLCSHGKPKVRRTVQKAGPNKGREFYVCGESDQCENSFEFIDGPTTTTTTNNSTSVPPCQCNKPSVKRTVTSQTENHGRPFYTCAAGRDQGCRFFEWAD
ncbi:DNA topoisomerase, partial [Rhizopus stolonifer]